MDLETGAMNKPVMEKAVLRFLGNRRGWYSAALLLVIAVILFGLRSHQAFRQALLESFHAQQAMFALSVQNSILDHLHEVERDLQLLIKEILIEPSEGENLAAVLMRMFSTHFDNFVSVAIFSDAGEMLHVAPRKGVWSPALMENVKATIPQQSAGDKPFLTESFVGGDGRTLLSLCLPYRTAGGKARVMVGVLRIEDYILSYFPALEGRSMGMILAADDGNILSLLNTSHATDETMKRGNLFSLDKKCRNCHTNTAFDDLRHAFRREGIIHATTRIPGTTTKNRATVAFPVYNDRWSISVISPFESIQSAIGRNFTASLSLSLLSLLAIVVVSWLGHTALDMRYAVEKADAVRASEEKFRTTFESANDAFLIVGHDGRIIDLNHTAYERLGYAKEELLGRNLAMISSLESAALIPKQLRMLERERQGMFEATHRRKDGSIIPVEISARVVDFGGEPVILSVVRDITERKATETALRRYAREIEAANRMKDLFTDIVRHDLLNPLSVARGYADILLARGNDPERLVLLGSLKRSLDRFAEVINSAAQLSRLMETERLETKGLDLGEILTEGIRTFEGRFAAEGWEVVRSFTGPFPLAANPLLTEVFVNLIANVLKFSRSVRKVEVGIRDEGATWLAFVKDWGSGIADADKQRVFSRFERLGPRGTQGMGLGLAIVRRIIELHGGRVWVEDNPDGGSVFFAELPKAGPSGA